MKADEIIRSNRRTFSLEITPEARVILRVPHRVKMSEIESVLFKKRAWIRSKQQVILKRRSEIHPIEFAEGEREGHQKRALEILSGRVEWYAKIHGLVYQSVRISNAKKRWGSCSSRGSLRLNWRLVLAPPEVLDYVVAHELAHLKEPNHSRAFWERVRQMLPSYQQHVAWLKANHHLLEA